MRILLVITELDEGGAENALFQVATHLRNAGHECRVAAIFDADGPVGERLQGAGIEVDALGITGPLELARAGGLTRFVKAFRPDLVQSWLFHANVLARAAVPKEIPLVCALRVVEPRLSHVLPDRFSRRRVTRYVCVSDDVASFARERLKVPDEQIEVIGNGVAFDEFAAGREAERPTDILRGLSVGRATKQKGFDILLPALAGLPGDLDWRWSFVGAAPDAAFAGRLRKIAENRGIADRIDWVGQVPREEIAEQYAMATILALPSRWEGQPNVVLEAMASGLPTIAADVHGVTDFLGAITIVDENEPVSWRRAITELATDADRLAAQREAGIATARRRSWAAVAARYADLYEGLLSCAG